MVIVIDCPFFRAAHQPAGLKFFLHHLTQSHFADEVRRLIRCLIRPTETEENQGVWIYLDNIWIILFGILWIYVRYKSTDLDLFGQIIQKSFRIMAPWGGTWCPLWYPRRPGAGLPVVIPGRSRRGNCCLQGTAVKSGGSFSGSWLGGS